MPIAVSVVVPVLNERRFLPDLVNCIESQSLTPLEAIFADGGSDDGSRQWLTEAAHSRPWLRVVENPERIVPSAMNRAITVARGEVVARMDCHAWYPPTYLETLVGVLVTRPEVVAAGGPLTLRGQLPWGEAAAAVLHLPVAFGWASHRRGVKRGPTLSVPTPAYRRQAVLAAGGFDPTFRVNQDFELAVRLRKAGGIVWLEPQAGFVSFTRPNARGLATQMWRYGFFRARTLWKHPTSVRPRYLAPPSFLLALAGLLVVNRRLFVVVTLSYFSAAAVTGALAARTAGASSWRGALVLPVVHFSWGAGLLAGLWCHRRARVTTSSAGTARPAFAPRYSR